MNGPQGMDPRLDQAAATDEASWTPTSSLLEPPARRRRAATGCFR